MAFVAAFVRCGIRGFVRAGTRSFVLAPVRGLRSVVHLLLAVRVGGAETCAVLNLLFHSTGLSGLHFDVGSPQQSCQLVLLLTLRPGFCLGVAVGTGDLSLVCATT